MGQPTAAADAAATTLLSEVTPALSQLSERVEALQQQQSALMQTLQNCPLVDDERLERVETTT